MINLYCSEAFLEKARELSEGSNFTFAGIPRDLKSLDCGYVLFLDDLGLSLCQTGPKAIGPVRCDFVGGSINHRRLYGGGKSQLIAKAIGIKGKVRPYVADLTAGMGGDAFVLASLGCRVSMVERNSVIAALLQDGLYRATRVAPDHKGLPEILGRMAIFYCDGGEWLQALPDSHQPDVIYLDPMFPERKKSARVNKNMQSFQQIVGEDLDANTLLPRALERAIYRVVVKRPAQAPWLNNEKPGYTLAGKSVRFDIYPLKSMTGNA